jgi:hypothetical protein
MTVEELIKKLQRIENKKSQVKIDTSSSGILLYKGIRDVQINEAKNFVVIGLIKEE